MSIGKGVTKVASTAVTNTNSTGTELTYRVHKPVLVQRVSLVNTHADDVGAALVLTVVARRVAGDSASDETLFTMTPSAAVERGKGVYKDADDRYWVLPGEQILVNITTGSGATRTADLHLEMVEYPFAGVQIDNMVEGE